MVCGRIGRGNCQFYTAHFTNFASLILIVAATLTRGWYWSDVEERGLFKICRRVSTVDNWICDEVKLNDDSKPDYWFLTQLLCMIGCILFFLVGLALVVGSCGRPAYSHAPKVVAMVLLLPAVGVSAGAAAVYWSEVEFQNAYCIICAIAAAGIGLLTLLMLTISICLKDNQPYPYKNAGLKY